MIALRGAALGVSCVAATAVLSAAPVVTQPAQAGTTNVIICNAAVSDGGVSIWVNNNYWTHGYMLLRGDCWTFSRSGLAVLMGNATSWRVRTNPGAYGSCQTKDVSYPGSSDRYEYWVHDHSGC